MYSFKSFKFNKEYANRLKKTLNREITFLVFFPSAASGPSQWAPGTNQCKHWVRGTSHYSPEYTTSLSSNVSSLEVKDAFFLSFFAEILLSTGNMPCCCHGQIRFIVNVDLV